MDTTVILAQPRVSRLRADVIYVDHREALAGFGRVWQALASAEIQVFQMPEFSGGPLLERQICPTDIPKRAKQVRNCVLSVDEIGPPKSMFFIGLNLDL